MLTKLPKLPDPKKIPKDTYTGPTVSSNWIIPDLILCGGYPSQINDIRLILETGISTFISLQEDEPNTVGNKSARSRPYQQPARALADRELTFVSFPIAERLGAEHSEQILKFLYSEIFPRVYRNEKMYIHCHDGHGRTGMIAACILGILYGIGGGEALKYTSAFHGTRKLDGQESSPATLDQRLQVYTVVDKLSSIIKPPTPPRELTEEEEEDEKDEKPLEKVEESPQKSPKAQPQDDSPKDATPVKEDARPSTTPQKEETKTPVKLEELKPLVLPEFNPNEDMAGPTPASNWVIKDAVLTGEYPLDMGFCVRDKDKHTVTEKGKEPLKKIFDAGITTFVCLQSEIPVVIKQNTELREYKNYPSKRRPSTRLISPASKWIPYMDVADELAAKEYPGRKVVFIHIPIDDEDILSDKLMIDILTKDLIPRIKAGEKLYIHCGDGHGRSGVFAALILGLLYKLDGTSTLNYCQKFHNMRKITKGVNQSPTTHEHRMQVHRIIKALQ